MEMTKKNVKGALGIETDADLARFFGCLRQAVDQWPDDGLIPTARQWELRARRPDLFPAPDGAVPVAVEQKAA